MAPSASLARAAWRTSSYSNNGGECVEVATTDNAIAVRDNKDRQGAALTFSPQARERFARSLKG